MGVLRKSESGADMPDGFHLDPEPARLCDVRGFRTGIATCGLKRSGKPDVGVLFTKSERACGTAVFTRNMVAAAPVIVSRPRAEAGRLRAALVNSGNANCCTGERGLDDAREASALTSSLLGVSEDEILIASTGVIGRPLDMAKLREGVRAAASKALEDGRGDFAQAILTTDLVRKEASASGSLGEKPFRVAGVCKGSGMIAPNMATMLAFIVTDAVVERSVLRAVLPRIAQATFNRVTVDGDTSTNDTLCLIASGEAGNDAITEADSAGCGMLERAITAVSQELAMKIAADGEGATRFVEVVVTGAASDSDAELAARAIANSPLVKTAIHGADPNWGRILAAAGRSGACVDAALATVKLQDIAVFERGAPLDPVPKEVAERLKEKRVTVLLDLALGKGSAIMWTCDLTRGYIEINADYHT
jgi:glutamate N-acetyltransferase/amino-acid N-acetyltransferase